MPIEIRPLDASEHEAFNSLILGAFGMRPMPERAELEKSMPELNVRIGAFDGPRIVGAAGAFDVGMSTPGGEVRCSGLTRVAVAPTHRRQGILRQLMRFHLEDARRRGQAIASLWASEGHIYGRFGYGLASVRYAMSAERDRSAFHPAPEAEARVELLGEDEAAALFPPIWEAARALHPGMLSRSEAWWRIRRLREWSPSDGGPLQRAVLRIDGQPEAYALYRIAFSFDERAVPRGKLNVLEAVGASPRATRAIWRYLLDIDLMQRVECPHLAADHPLLLHIGEPRRLNLTVADALYVRVLDVPAALRAREHRGPERLRFALSDPLFPENAGVWALGDGEARRASGAPELSLDARAFGSVYLGGVSWRQLADSGQLTEHSPGAVRKADALFRAERAPWCPEIF